MGKIVLAALVIGGLAGLVYVRLFPLPPEEPVRRRPF